MNVLSYYKRNTLEQKYPKKCKSESNKADCKPGFLNRRAAVSQRLRTTDINQCKYIKYNEKKQLGRIDVVGRIILK
jgi:hypothetical protein